MKAGAPLRTPREARLSGRGCGCTDGRRLCFLVYLQYFPHFLPKPRWLLPQEEPGRGRRGGRAAGSAASPSSGDPKVPTALRPEGHTAAALPVPLCPPATNRSRGRRGPSSSGTARCSVSETRRKRLLCASSRCPRPPVLHSGIFLTSIFHSAVIKWKTLLKPREVTLKRHEMQTDAADGL